MTREKKIVLIGPVYPYRGGIAHYTSLLFRALAEQASVTMLSFKKQYPGWLFRRKQKDYSNASLKIDNAEFLLDTTNPFNIIKVARYINRLEPDMLILQWWHPYFTPCYWILMHICKKCKIVLICHNVLPHERFPLDSTLTKSVFNQASCFIVHAKEEAEELIKLIPHAEYRINPHPTYDFFRFENLTKEDAREKLNIDINAKTILFFGFVRAYKGLKTLLYAMPKVIKSFSEIKLMIVGEFSNDKEDYLSLIDELKIKEHLLIVDNYVADSEVEAFFAASDVVALPYESATQSGIVQIAYGFEKPVIATMVGGLPDVVEDGKTGYLVKPHDSDAFAEAIIKFFENEKSNNFVNAIKENAYQYSWERMADTILSFGE